MQIFINIVVFIVALLLVICIHELGHFMVAKICNVYCFEYSIGFGPAIFKHKFKHKRYVHPKQKKDEPLYDALTKDIDKEGKYEKVEGETQFCIRLLPLGGYVSMAGEDDDDADIKVPKNRTLNGVNHFKQICIMLAGIAMNFILCFLLFFISFSFCPQTAYHNDSNTVEVAKDTAIYDAGLRSGDKITSLYQVYENLVDIKTQEVIPSISFPAEGDRQPLDSYMLFNDGASSGTFDELEHTSIAYASQNMLTIEFENNPFADLVANANSKRIIHLDYVDSEGVTHEDISFTISPELVDDVYVFENMGISATSYNFTYGAAEGVKIAGQQFGNLFVGIYHALGNLFTASGWQNIGGLISVYQMSAQGVESGSIAYVLYLWGYISLNLGCFNLLPIPGLDGWQTLIALGETITRKKAPTKFKAIANTIGLLLLLGLGVALIIKDVIMF